MQEVDYPASARNSTRLRAVPDEHTSSKIIGKGTASAVPTWSADAYLPTNPSVKVFPNPITAERQLHRSSCAANEVKNQCDHGEHQENVD